ncbi:MAG: AMP-binding protein [Clostridia bacterium]|nr:AMP-binding protein [Clostridia bacterium]
MKVEEYFDVKEFQDIKEIIYNSTEKYGERIAFTIKHKNGKDVTYEDITYKKLLEDINTFGTKLYELGFKNKRIAIVGRNRYEWVIAHFANLLGGIISIPLDKELQVDELESCLSRSKADVVVFDEKYIENIKEIQKRENTNIKEYICMTKQEGYKDFWELKEQGEILVKEENRTDYIDAKINKDEMAILLFTSGTTSKSKAVMLSQYNIASNVHSMLIVEEILPTDTNLAFLPFHHIFGSTCMVVMLAAGVRTAFPDGLRYVAQNLKEYKVTIFVGVPILIEAIYNKIEKAIEKQGKTKLINIAKKISNLFLKLKIDIRKKLFKQVIDELGGHLRFVISGGAPLDKKVAQGFNEIGINIVQGYGLTETSPVISAENYKKQKYGSVGFAMKNVELELVNKDEKGIGEVRVKGPNVMLGYYENEEETNKVIRDGWFYTGDLGYFDKQGYLFLTGRQKDMIVLKNGKKVFPEEIETLINRIELVEECMVFGMPDENDKNDLKPSVKVVYNKDVAKESYPDCSEEDLKQIIWTQIKEINKTFPTYKYIKNLILTDEELIKTTTKKVKRNEELKKILG